MFDTLRFLFYWEECSHYTKTNVMFFGITLRCDHRVWVGASVSTSWGSILRVSVYVYAIHTLWCSYLLTVPVRLLLWSISVSRFPENVIKHLINLLAIGDSHIKIRSHSAGTKISFCLDACQDKMFSLLK